MSFSPRADIKIEFETDLRVRFGDNEPDFSLDAFHINLR